MFSSLASDRTVVQRRPGISSVLILLAAMLLALLTTGCGGGDSADEDSSGDGVILAKVGKVDITSQYYEDRLGMLEAKELPRENGAFLDMSTDQGKQAFLDNLVKKELMNLKAHQLGYGDDPKLDHMRKIISNYEGTLLMWAECVGDVGDVITDDELNAYYNMMGIQYNCQYIICNFEDDALEAREYAMSGADWEDVTSKYHDGLSPAYGVLKIKVPYGQYSAEFDAVLFATELNEVSMPISTSYGFWVLKPIKIVHGEKPDLEESKDQILTVTRNRKIGMKQTEFKASIREEYEFTIYEDAAWAAYQGLPETGIMDPETNKPFTKDQLIPLDIKTEDLGLVLYSYEAPGEEIVEMVLGDYKGHFDNMSVFQRPKKSEMYGGFRLKLRSEVERNIFAKETERRGYYEHPEVLLKVKKKVEEAMVTELYNDVVVIDDLVSKEQLDEFWNAHKGEYRISETRDGHLVVCTSREKADHAREAILKGTLWTDILKKFGSDPANIKAHGEIDKISSKSLSPLMGPLFSLEAGGVSQPFDVGNGHFAVVMLGEIVPARDYEMTEASENMRGRILGLRKEEAFAQYIEQWAEEFGVQLFPENLAGLKSWNDIHPSANAGVMVPSS